MDDFFTPTRQSNTFETSDFTTLLVDSGGHDRLVAA
jgi:hypothetical protein